MLKYEDGFHRNPPAGFDGVFDWDFLKAAWNGTKVEPMDFDAVVERGGRFLTFETKDPGVPLKDGQRFTLERVVQRKNFTVILCNKTKADIDANGFEIWEMEEGIFRKQRCHGTSEHLIRVCRDWFVGR